VTGWRYGEPRRALLVQAYLHCAGAAAAERERLLREFGMRHGLPMLHHTKVLNDTPRRLAVQVVHALDLAPPALQLWQVDWGMDETTDAGESLALSAAQLLAERDELLLLVARPGGSGAALGALVDAQSCGRIAVAGFDVDAELAGGRQCAALESAGDLLYGERLAPAVEASPGVWLLLGLKQHASAAD
jgi:hypothetical protein